MHREEIHNFMEDYPAKNTRNWKGMVIKSNEDGEVSRNQKEKVTLELTSTPKKTPKKQKAKPTETIKQKTPKTKKIKVHTPESSGIKRFLETQFKENTVQKGGTDFEIFAQPLNSSALSATSPDYTEYPEECDPTTIHNMSSFYTASNTSQLSEVPSGYVTSPPMQNCEGDNHTLCAMEDTDNNCPNTDETISTEEDNRCKLDDVTIGSKDNKGNTNIREAQGDKSQKNNKKEDNKGKENNGQYTDNEETQKKKQERNIKDVPGGTKPDDLSDQDNNMDITNTKMLELLTERITEIKTEIRKEVKEELSTMSTGWTCDIQSYINKSTANEKKIETLELCNRQKTEELVQVREELATCKNTLDRYADALAYQEHKLGEVYRKVESQELQQNRGNLFISGIKETDTEDCVKTVKNFLTITMSIQEEIPIQKAFRVGTGSYRPIKVILKNPASKSIIFKNVSKLKDVKNEKDHSYQISTQLPPRLSAAQKKTRRTL